MLRNIDMASAEEDAASRIMVFRPTLAEFSDFSSYITHMEATGAHNYGIAKVSCTPVSLIDVALVLDICLPPCTTRAHRWCHQKDGALGLNMKRPT